MNKTKCECKPRGTTSTAIARPTDTTSAGTTTRTYAAHLTVRCDWDRVGSREDVVFGARRVRRTWRTSVDAKTDILRGDRCVFTDEIGQHTAYVIDASDEGDDRRIDAEELT